MTRPVYWSREALDDLKEQVAFICQEPPIAAQRIADRIRDTATTLGVRATGRPGRMAGTYEKSVSRLPYIVAYAVANHAGRESIMVLRVIHTTRDWTPEKWPH